MAISYIRAMNNAVWATLVATIFATAAAADEPPTSRPISDAVGQGMWSACGNVKLKLERPGFIVVTGPDRVVTMSVKDRCEVARGISTISVNATVRDQTTNEDLALLTRTFAAAGLSCEDTRKRALAKDFARPNSLLCSEGLHPLGPEPLDLTVQLLPTFSKGGPLSMAMEGDGVVWTVNNRPLRLVGEVTCAPGSRVLENEVYGELRPWTLRYAIELKDPKAKTKLGSFLKTVNVLGSDCSTAMALRSNSQRVQEAIGDLYSKALAAATTP